MDRRRSAKGHQRTGEKNAECYLGPGYTSTGNRQPEKFLTFPQKSSDNCYETHHIWSIFVIAALTVSVMVRLDFSSTFSDSSDGCSCPFPAAPNHKRHSNFPNTISRSMEQPESNTARLAVPASTGPSKRTARFSRLLIFMSLQMGAFWSCI